MTILLLGNWLNLYTTKEGARVGTGAGEGVKQGQGRSRGRRSRSRGTSRSATGCTLITLVPFIIQYTYTSEM